MKKENQAYDRFEIAREFMKRGFKCEVLKGGTTPLLEQQEKEAKAFVMKIEEAHKRAANSTLRFGSILVSNFQVKV